jgi:hypothetical protein
MRQALSDARKAQIMQEEAARVERLSKEAERLSVPELSA